MTKEEYEIEFKKRQNRFLWLFPLTALAVPLFFVNSGVALFFGVVNLFYSIFLNRSARAKADEWYCANYERCLGQPEISFENLTFFNECPSNTKNEFIFEGNNCNPALDDEQAGNSKAV